jgi:hypothetical protein
MAIGDFDNDSLPDLAAANIVGTGSGLLHNNGDSTFSIVSLSTIAGDSSFVSVGDYDNDGNQDILFGDNQSYGTTISVLHNNGSGSFTGPRYFVANRASGLEWGDVDNDGDLDLAILDKDGFSNLGISIFLNDGAGTFSDTHSWLAINNNNHSFALGDCDRDGDLDIFTGGSIFKNAGQFTNTAPAAPSGLSSSMNGLKATLNWTAPTDDHTPSTGLTYNVRVGTNPGANDILCGSSDAAGVRRMPGIGNAGGQCSFTLSNLPTGTYYWSVQAIDSAYVGSVWSAGASFTVSGIRISGHVATSSGANVEGVRVSANSGGGTTFSDSTGDYSVCVPIGWQGTVTPSKSLFTFNPACISYPSVTADITGQNITAIPYLKISGRLKDNTGSGVSGFTISSNDGRSSTTNNQGYYEIMVPSGWSGTISPNQSNCIFVPSGISYINATTDQPNRDYILGAFTDINAGLPGVQSCSVAWGDYDNDGDLDIALAGQSSTTPIARIYRNNGAGSFTDINAGLTGVTLCSLAWGDYDNDGDLDLAVAGSTINDYISRIYRNNGNGTFCDISAGLTGVACCSLAWGDYDNDGDLDLAISGADTGGNPITKIYRNDIGRCCGCRSRCSPPASSARSASTPTSRSPRRAGSRVRRASPRSAC